MLYMRHCLRFRDIYCHLTLASKMATRIALVLCVAMALTIEPGYAFLIPGALQSVHTNVGEIHGELANVEYDGRILQTRKFLGIPYAKPPVGDLRFRKPEALAALPRSPFKAMTFGNICPQPFADYFGFTNRSEDCLYLNVFTPSSTDFDDVTDGSTAPKAVMVWIHGGAFFIGFSDIFDGSALSAFNDVIVVIINYRLGPLGFFSTHDDNAPGNYGLWDQQLAIQWVRDNVAAFGGDPDNISIFGESAGGSSVVYQTLYPGNRGLVKRAIAESGTISAWAVDRLGNNYKSSMQLAVYLGCNDSKHEDVMKCLRSKSEEEIKIATEQFQSESSRNYAVFKTWIPVYDNDFIRADTNTILSDLSKSDIDTEYTNTFRGIDFMIGDNSLDGLVYLGLWLYQIQHTSNLTGQYGFTNKDFSDIIMPLIAEMVFDEEATSLVIEAIKYEYLKWDDPNNDTARLQALVDITTDFALNAPSILTANGHQLGNKSTYVYRFAVAGPGHGLVPVPPVLQNDRAAAHSDEILFLFGFPEAVKRYGINFTRADITAEKMRISKAMMTMWTNFAKSGDPNRPVDVQQFYRGVTWPEYDAHNAKYLEIAPGMSAQSTKANLATRAVQFWNNLLPELQAVSKGLL